MTKEQILNDLFYKPEDRDWYNVVLHAMDLYARSKWQEACEAQLELIAIGFKENQHKAERLSDKEVFQAIGETIKNYPKPDFK